LPLIATAFATGVTYLWMVYCHTEVVFVWIMIIQELLVPDPRLCVRGCRGFDRSGASSASSPAHRDCDRPRSFGGARLEASYGIKVS